MPRRLLLALALATACARGTADAPPPLDTPPAEPPPVPAEVAPEPEPEPEPEPPPPAPTLDLAATARETGDLTTFLTAVDAAGLRDMLTGPGPLTVFAPSDAAFAALPKGELDRLLKNKKKLTALLGHHIVVGAAVSAAELPTQTTPLRTVAGTDLTPSTLATPSRPDLGASNGVLHVIDVVLQPSKPGAKLPANKTQEPAKKSQEPAKKSQEPAAKPSE